MQTSSSKVAAALAVALAAGFFLYFAGDSLAAYFTPDDLMNLYNSWVRPWEEDRPVGAFFYHFAFQVFGFDPFPYRVVCFLLLAGNLALLYGFALRLARSHFVAGLTCLLGAYHAHLADLYYSTGTIYDLLCFAFWFGAFVWYASLRERGRTPAWWQVALMLVLYAGAIGSKEMAVSLPAFLVIYELAYFGREPGWRRWSFAAAALLVTVAYVGMKFGGRHRMADNPAYALHFSLAVFNGNWTHFLGDIFYRPGAFTPARMAWFFMIALAAAAALRRREMLCGLALFFFGSLPVTLIAGRGIYVLYVTLPGLYLYFAALADAAMPRRVPYREIVLAAAMAALLFPLHRREKAPGKAWVAEAFASVRVLREQLRDRYPTMPKGASILLTDDPYPADDFIVHFIFRLQYRDLKMEVHRVKQIGNRAGAPETYNYVFAMREGKLIQLRP